MTDENQNQYRWYVINVRKRQEDGIIKRIHLELAKKPELELGLRVKDIKVIVRGNNILKGFIFLCADLNYDLVNLCYSVPGIIGFLRHIRPSRYNRKNYPLPESVEADFIEKLSHYEESAADVTTPTIETKTTSPEELKVGDHVKILEGPFVSFEGTIIKIHHKKQEINVNLEYDGQQNLVKDIHLEKLPCSHCTKKDN